MIPIKNPPAFLSDGLFSDKVKKILYALFFDS